MALAYKKNRPAAAPTRVP
jgi:hypothetical protein